MRSKLFDPAQVGSCVPAYRVIPGGAGYRAFRIVGLTHKFSKICPPPTTSRAICSEAAVPVLLDLPLDPGPLARGEIMVNGPGLGIKCVYSADELCVWCGKFYRYRYKVFTYRYKVCVWFSSIGIKYVYGAENSILRSKPKYRGVGPQGC